MRIAIFVAVVAISGLSGFARADKACYDVQGMTCATCGVTVKAAIKKLNGIQEAKASVEKKNAVVQFDPNQTSVEAIEKVIDETGFKATVKECQAVEG